MQMLKFSIHEDKGELFETLAHASTTNLSPNNKTQNSKNLPGYYSGVLRELIDKALFSDAFMDYDVAVEGFFYR